MGLRFKKSKKVLPGVTLNLNKSSASVSLGPKGMKQTFSTTGRSTTTVGLPGTGLHYTQPSSYTRNASDSSLFGVPTSQRPTSPKNKWVALILCIFFGFVGFHRFYVGKTGTGIIWFCTAGMFFIGWVIDIITIATNAFYDTDGYVLRGAGVKQISSLPKEPGN